jgi:hypothetical protein
LVALSIIALVFAALAPAAPAGALPEYSAQTGEPCATCHNSPSGGGLRTPRVQAWVADSRPGAAPSLSEALALLGVKLSVNEADFVAPDARPRPAAQPASGDVAEPELRQWLNRYGGN